MPRELESGHDKFTVTLEVSMYWAFDPDLDAEDHYTTEDVEQMFRDAAAKHRGARLESITVTKEG